MKLLLDENLPRSLGAWFPRHGVMCSDVLSEGLLGRPDRDLANFASQNAFVILTKDSDFDVLAITTPGLTVIRLTAGNMRTAELIQFLGGKIDDIRRALESRDPLTII